MKIDSDIWEDQINPLFAKCESKTIEFPNWGLLFISTTKPIINKFSLLDFTIGSHTNDVNEIYKSEIIILYMAGERRYIYAGGHHFYQDPFSNKITLHTQKEGLPIFTVETFREMHPVFVSWARELNEDSLK